MGVPWEAIDQWLDGLGPEDAAVAFAIAGLVAIDEPDGLATPTEPGFTKWRFDGRWLAESAERALETPGASELFVSRGVAPVYRGGPPLLRVAVRGKTDFSRVSQLLLAVPRLDSVVLAANRPAETPRRRPWNWPLRIGLLGVDAPSDDVTESVLQLGLGLNAEQLRVVDVLAQPSFSDVLVVVAGVTEAVQVCRARRLRANAVVVIGPPEVDGSAGVVAADGSAPVQQVAALAQLRKATGATSAALVRRVQDDELQEAMNGTALADASPEDQAAARLVGHVLMHSAHGYPWDAAITAASDRQLWLAGELDPLTKSDIKSIGREMATSMRVEAEAMAAEAGAQPDLHLPDWSGADSAPTSAGGDSGGRGDGFGDGFAMAEPPDRDVLDSVVRSMSQVESIVDNGAFMRVSGEAAALPPLLDSAGKVLDAASSKRLLLCEVNRDPDDEEGKSQPIAAGRNVVEVSIGRPRKGAKSVQGFDFDQLFDNDQRKLRITIVFVPRQPGTPAIEKNIMLPRVGDTRRAVFEWDIPADATRGEARIMVIHRNRLLQTARLSGEVGQEADLVEMTLVRTDLNGLDDRRAFDLTLLVEGDDGAESLIAHGERTTDVVRNEVGDLTDVRAIAARMRALLDEESFAAGSRRKPNPESMRQLLVALAQEGRHLHLRLLGLVEGLADCEYLQLVTATPGWFVPLEFIYPHEPPDDDAQVCPDWLPGGEGKCGGRCIVDDNPKLVCPGAFWGMSRVIERHYRGPRLAGGVSSKEKVDSLTSSEPTAERRRLQLDNPVIAASERVSEADTKSVVEELGEDAAVCANWDEWTTTLKAEPRHLLALLPHTNKGTLEIGGDVQKSAVFASKRYLTGGNDVEPVVLMLGCHTAGSDEDPAGYASDVLVHGGAIVVTSLSLLLNKHAAEYARRLIDELGAAGRKARPVATVMREFRREAVFAGYPTALAITAYGDSDWSV